MGHTGLTVGGFTQPSVVKTIISNPSNSDKGLCQRFLWLVPKPVAVSFEQLQQVNKDFCTSIGMFSLSTSVAPVLNVILFLEGLMATMWRDSEHIRHWTLKRSCVTFKDKYDAVKDQLLDISCFDDLLSGVCHWNGVGMHN